VEGKRGTFPARSISACAEVPIGHGFVVCMSGVYLRVCGGTADPEVKAVIEGGLSPRVRRYQTGASRRWA